MTDRCGLFTSQVWSRCTPGGDLRGDRAVGQARLDGFTDLNVGAASYELATVRPYYDREAALQRRQRADGVQGAGRQLQPRADAFEHVNRFFDVHDVGAALSRAGFTEPVLDVDRLTRYCSDPRELMRELRAHGAHNVRAGRARGLTGRRRLQAMLGAYAAQAVNCRSPVSCELIFGCAWAPLQSVVAVNVADIRTRSR